MFWFLKFSLTPDSLPQAHDRLSVAHGQRNTVRKREFLPMRMKRNDEKIMVLPSCILKKTMKMFMAGHVAETTKLNKEHRCEAETVTTLDVQCKGKEEDKIFYLPLYTSTCIRLSAFIHI